MDIRNELKHHNIRYTKQRASVLDILKQSPIPLTLVQIREMLQKRAVDIDLSTIYRILDVFENKNIINKVVHLEPSNSVYDYQRHVHKHHLICLKCGLIEIIEGCPLENYEETVASKSGFVIKRHQLELYGICPDCQALG